MSFIARAPSTLSTSASESPGKEKLWKSESPGVRMRRKMIERDNPLSVVTQVTKQCTTTNNLLKARTPHAAQGGTMTKLGLLKSGKLINRWMIERRNPLSLLGQGHTSSNQVSLMRRPSTLFWKKKKLMIERGHPLSALKEEQGHSNSSLETTKQKWNWRQDQHHSWMGLMIRCGKGQKRTLINVTENDEKHSVTWGMFMSVTMESAVFIGKNFSDNQHSIEKTKDLTMKQMVDIIGVRTR